MRRLWFASRTGLSLLTCLAASCLSDRTAPDAGLSLEVIGGDGQRGPVAEELPDPLVVRVTDGRGHGVRDQIVNFVVVSGGGAVFAGTALTDRAGMAREYWTLGTVAAEPNRLEVRAVDPTTGVKQTFAVFNATGLAGAVATVTVSPASGSVSVSRTLQLGAVLADRFGNAISDRSPEWRSGDEALATVSSTGLVTGVRSGGPVTITATSGGVSGSASVIVVPVVGSVTVTPSSPSVQLLGTVQLNAVVRDGDGTILPDQAVTWESLTPGVATVSATGLVRGEEGGTATIRASSEGVSGTAGVTVTIPVDSVAVSPSSATLEVGATLGFTAQPLDARDRPIARSVTWSSSDASVARIQSSSGATALVEAMGAGTADIRATSEGVVGVAAISVTGVVPDAFEPNETGAGARDLGSGSTQGGTWQIAGNIHSLTDRDWFFLRAAESSGFCFPGSGQSFRITVTLTGIPAGRDYDLAVYDQSPSGTRFASANSGNANESIAVDWGGTCGSDDSRVFYIEIFRFSGAPSAQLYTLSVSLQER